jgi:hypothetical protein
MGKEIKDDCLKNCKEPGFAKCNLRTGKCEGCNKTTDKDCKFTKDVCDASCKPQGDVQGQYRGISIATGFAQGEWDFDFTAASTTKITLYPDRPPGQTLKETFEATPDFSGTSQSTDGLPISFTFTQSGGMFKIGDKLTGMYKKQPDQQGIFTLVTIGTGKANQAAPASFDAAMKDGYMWRLVSCKQPGATGCDISVSTGPASKHGVYDSQTPPAVRSITIN